MQGTNWVKVCERLPNDETTVLVFSKGYIWIADVDHSGQFYPDEWSYGRDIIADEITHWMPLPLPPMPEGE